MSDLTSRGSKSHRRSKRAARRRLRFESLEDRRLLAGLLVTTTDDVVDPSDGVVSLREAVAEANGNGEADVIRFHRRVQGTIELTEQLVLEDDVEIRGRNARQLTISGEESSRVFHVEPGVEASFRRLTIANGLASDAPGYVVPIFAFGGGIYNEGGTVHLSNVTMRNNQAGPEDELGTPLIPIVAGGGIANEFGGVLTVSHSHFENNRATGLFTGVGGAITSDSGDASFGTELPPAPTGSPTVEISHSVFTANMATNLLGPTAGIPLLSGLANAGAIFSIAGSLDVDHSTFIGNEAIGGGDADEGPSVARGGAITVMDFSPFGSGEATLNISHSRFRNNAARGGESATASGGEALGGAVAILEGAEATIHHTRFVGNTAEGGDGPVAGGDGGGGAIGMGIFAGLVPDPSATLLASHTVFVGNQAVGGSGTDGGAGQGGAIIVASGASANFQRATMIRNRATGGGGGGIGQGGAVFNGVGSTTSLRRSFVIRNRATGGAGGGIGQGGGLFNELDDDDDDDGVFNLDGFTEFFTRFNRADEGPNFFGF